MLRVTGEHAGTKFLLGHFLTVDHLNRLNIEAFVSAAFVTLVRIVRCPSFASAEADLALARSALTQAKCVIQSNEFENTCPSLQTCLILQTLAENLVVQEKSKVEAMRAPKHPQESFE